ncbi:hypothetical protein [Pseudoalteromonas obscura]|uniref:Uncharacterized protein n=1 Tax=Pseudoalteromonas obscura TaxID=3048491 RepID=A0ABT7EEG4_9GAMM|nr:hypothetical protein [Pseudoalteromonas sp. P94(2023)]MDK2593668.1 hypothetical protein [Pseudoalteromonas sp. P94(2023)]
MTTKYLAGVASILFTVGVQAATMGNYVPFSQQDYINNGYNGPGVKAPLNGNQFDPMVCIDGRRVPGVVSADGNCYVEYKKNWRNSDYSILMAPSGGYTWKRIGRGYNLTGKEITGGARDSGEYSYHCMAEKYINGYGKIKVVGKYIPNQDRCYLTTGEREGDRTHIDIDYWRSPAWILVAN